MVQGRKITNYGPKAILDFNTSFEMSLSKLSDNQKISDIGSTILNLWLLKDSQLQLPILFDLPSSENERKDGTRNETIEMEWLIFRHFLLNHPSTAW